VVRDGQGDSPLSQVTVAVVDGGNAGRSTTTANDGSYALSALQQGTFSIRFARDGFITVDQSVTLNANATLNLTLPRTCNTPAAPTNLAATITSTGIRTFTWTAGSAATEYVVEAGTSPGGAEVLSATTTSTSYVWNAIPNGTYYARVKGRNTCATSIASNEVVLTVGNTPSPSPSPSPTPSPSPSPSPSRQRIGAVCKDGTPSSATGSGACSSHGGVACWRYSDGTCTNP